MARVVRIEGVRPIKLEPQAAPAFICACGLTKKFPLCDGSHKVCADETPGATYIYESDSVTRREVARDQASETAS